MTDDSKQTQKLPMLPSEPPRSSQRPSLDPEWLDEESSTRDTDSAIALPPITPRHAKTRAVLTVVSGPSTGRVYAIEGDAVLGRGRDCSLRIDDPGASREHARITVTTDHRHVIEDLGSLNGTYVDGRRIDRAELQSGDRINMGPNVVIAFAIIDVQAERIAHQLYESSVRDPLTRAHNRRYLVERLASEIAYANRHRSRLGLILFDLDHFKRVNDTHGHLAGDDVLRDVAALVQRLIRAEDVFARYGGEEFVILVRGIEHVNVGRFAERLRSKVEQLEIAGDRDVLHVTISAGYASLEDLPKEQRTADDLLRTADERLYRSKQAGRNRATGA
ncbi:MAG TPA: GGDEF domain-containing protein [Polyangiaceae bacterium]